MKTLQQITTSILLCCCIAFYSTTVFAGNNNGKDNDKNKKETNSNASSGTVIEGLSNSYMWTPPTILSDCTAPCAADAGPDKSYCGCCGAAPVLGGSNNCSNSNSCPASGAKTFSWTPATGLSATNICHPTATPATTTTYTLTVTFNCGSGAGVADCCCDGCQGTGNVCHNSPYCSGSISHTDVVVVTVACPGGCCRIANPEKQAEVLSDDVILYPNPSTGIFTLSLFKKIEPNTSIRVYNMAGDAVWSNETVDPDYIHNQIDLSKEAKGIYFMSVLHNEKVLYYKKVVLQ